jgi:ParB family chromosome partitioning protein
MMELTNTARGIAIENLTPYAAHPFKPYEGERLDGLVESIRERGVLVPIIVRPADGDKYEILSGHNRVKAAEIAELNTIPAIVREGLTDDEALLVVTETNLIQRSFGDMSHSERAKVIAVHYAAIKQKGYRTKFLEEVEELVPRYSPMGNNLSTTSMSKIGSQYGLSKNTIARYLRLAKLIPSLLDRLGAPAKPLPLRAGVSLSYLRENEQEFVVAHLDKLNITIDIRKAEELRKMSEMRELTADDLDDLWRGETKPAAKRRLFFERATIDQYFTSEQSDDEIAQTIAEALEQYFANR